MLAVDKHSTSGIRRGRRIIRRWHSTYWHMVQCEGMGWLLWWFALTTNFVISCMDRVLTILLLYVVFGVLVQCFLGLHAVLCAGMAWLLSGFGCSCFIKILLLIGHPLVLGYWFCRSPLSCTNQGWVWKRLGEWSYNGPKNLHFCVVRELHVDSRGGKVVGRGFSLLCDVHFPRRFIGPTGQNLGVSKSRWFHVVMFQVLFIYLLFIQDNWVCSVQSSKMFRDFLAVLDSVVLPPNFTFSSMLVGRLPSIVAGVCSCLHKIASACHSNMVVHIMSMLWLGAFAFRQTCLILWLLLFSNTYVLLLYGLVWLRKRHWILCLM